jgi:hypothetical protein
MKTLFWVGLAAIATGVHAGGFPSFLSSPGESIDFTYFDQQHTCSVGRMIVQDRIALGGLHVCYLKTINTNQIPRNAAYQFNDRAGGGWTGEIDANTARSGPVNIDVLSDGRAVVVFHQSGGIGLRTVAAMDAARGAGAFTVFSMDTTTYPPGSGAPLWPKVAVGPTDLIHVTGCGQTNACIYYIRWTPGDTTARWITIDSLVNSFSNVVFTSRSSGKLAVAYTKPRPSSPGNVNMDVWYRESTNHGLTWGPKVNVTNYLNSDTVRAYCDVSGVYDNNDNLHLVWSGERVIGDTAYYNAAAIFHWSAATGMNVVSGPGNVPGTWWWSVTANPGTWNLCATRPSLSRDTMGDLFCVFSSQRNDDDSSAAGYINMDLYGTKSMDGGDTWSPTFNITNSHTPGGAAGACDDDRFPSLTAFTTDSVRVLWVVDRDAGTSLQGEGATTLNPIHYLAMWKGPGPGVERHSLPNLAIPGSFELGPCLPNPASRMTAVKYALPVPREVDLSVYNVQGQLVKRLVSGYKTPGYHSVKFDASTLPAGVYLYCLSAGEFTQTRTMVVVR